MVKKNRVKVSILIERNYLYSRLKMVYYYMTQVRTKVCIIHDKKIVFMDRCFRAYVTNRTSIRYGDSILNST